MTRISKHEMESGASNTPIRHQARPPNSLSRSAPPSEHKEPSRKPAPALFKHEYHNCHVQHSDSAIYIEYTFIVSAKHELGKHQLGLIGRRGRSSSASSQLPKPTISVNDDD